MVHPTVTAGWKVGWGGGGERGHQLFYHAGVTTIPKPLNRFTPVSSPKLARVRGFLISSDQTSRFPFIRSGQNHLARHSERGKKIRQTEEEVGRQHQGMDRPGLRQVPEGSGEQGKMEETGCKSSVVPQRPSRLRD